ncbi:MAG: hypothetical protein ACOCRK_02985 [bacterium]
MILYHLTANLNHDGNFIKRIPSEDILHHQMLFNEKEDKFEYWSENNTIPRICVSTSVNGCASAIPYGGLRFKELVETQNRLFKLFKIDTDKLDLNNHIWNWEYLYKNDYVRDSLHTDEHWILKDFSVPKEDEYIITVGEWYEVSEDVVPPYIYYETMDGNGDYIGLFESIYGICNLPCMVVIEDLDYKIIEGVDING